MWSRKFEKCIKCGRSDRKHTARGLCILCYQIDIENKHKKHQRGLKIAASKLTKQYIVENYITGSLSLSDIAAKCGCSRQYIFKKMCEYGIAPRSKRLARDLALRKGKIVVDKIDDAEQKHSITYQRIEYNTAFFSKWSPEMAYVLGVLYTDGCLHIASRDSRYGLRYQPVLSVTQKEPELLLKILTLMNCNAKLAYRQNKKYNSTTAGAVYSFSFVCAHIYSDLTRLGLKPAKSLDISFPEVPLEYLRHFIRGCWDGDGSVYYETRNEKICASYVSGSLEFMQQLVTELSKAGLPLRKIYIRNTTPASYYIRFTGSQCELLYHYFYDGVPSEQRLERKYQKFSKYFGPLALKKPIQKTLF